MTINEIQNEIIENFSDAGDWLDKYEWQKHYIYVGHRLIVMS